jgi:hypothetical protein
MPLKGSRVDAKSLCCHGDHLSIPALAGLDLSFGLAMLLVRIRIRESVILPPWTGSRAGASSGIVPLPEDVRKRSRSWQDSPIPCDGHLAERSMDLGRTGPDT